MKRILLRLTLPESGRSIPEISSEGKQGKPAFRHGRPATQHGSPDKRSIRLSALNNVVRLDGTDGLCQTIENQANAISDS